MSYLKVVELNKILEKYQRELLKSEAALKRYSYEKVV